MSESKEQQALIKWCELRGHPYNLMFAVPNEGKRSYKCASRMKAEGLKSGVPDLVFPVARGGFHGLFIEMKYGKGKLSDNQDVWLNHLIAQGYFCMVCYTWTSAQEQLETYMSLPD